MGNPGRYKSKINSFDGTIGVGQGWVPDNWEENLDPQFLFQCKSSQKLRIDV